MEKFKEAAKENNIQLMKEIDEKLEALQKVKRPSDGDGEQKKEEPTWKHPGEFLQAVARVETKRVQDPRLVYEKYDKALGMSEGVGAEGLLGQSLRLAVLIRHQLKYPKAFRPPFR